MVVDTPLIPPIDEDALIGPLLALTANQIAKVQQADQRYATVEVHHLDDFSSDALKNRVIPRMWTLWMWIHPPLCSSSLAFEECHPFVELNLWPSDEYEAKDDNLD